jgi:hypothetical protein
LAAENIFPARQELARPRIAVVCTVIRDVLPIPATKKIRIRHPHPRSRPCTPGIQRSRSTASNPNGISPCPHHHAPSRSSSVHRSAGAGRPRPPRAPGGRGQGRRRCAHASSRIRFGPVDRSRSSRARSTAIGVRPAAVWDLAGPSWGARRYGPRPVAWLSWTRRWPWPGIRTTRPVAGCL